jgi:DMSO/TMAO reductase YedYZ molybdopterin-dependent catalytic subunit
MSESTLRERLRPLAPPAAVSLAAGVAAVLGSFGLVGFTPAFPVAPVESLLSRLMPGAVVTFAITVLGNVGQQLNLAFAGFLVVLFYAALVWVALGFRRQINSPLIPVVVTVLLVWVGTAMLALDIVAASGAAAGAALVVAVSELSPAIGRFTGEPTSDGNGRRRALSALGTAAIAGAVGTAIGRTQTADGSGDSRASGGDSTDPGEMDLTYDVEQHLTTAMERSFDVEGMEPSISEKFFNVSISSVSPAIAPPDWTLSVTGAVDEELELTYEDLQSMDHEHRFLSLRCVGEQLNGHKMDTALWTGVPVKPIIEEAAPTSDCECVMLRAEGDGFYEEFPLEALEPGMLAYGMNGQPLPRSHGAPVRALVPGHWGEVNVKWLTEIEFLERETDGYWEKRGWHGTGPVKTVAKLHGKERHEDGRVVVGGHTYAGTRGVSAVEVSTDGGDTWAEAELTERLPGASGPAADVGGGGDSFAADAWRLWKYAYEPDGEHEVVVRAIEEDGTVQTREETGPVPDGPAGWVSETIDPSTL